MAIYIIYLQQEHPEYSDYNRINNCINSYKINKFNNKLTFVFVDLFARCIKIGGKLCGIIIIFMM
ncbi:hypothetical protein BB987_08975 [Photorhabdus temperata]|uniref:Uncharacterized protein n=2 Tax=Photorhabdus khanii TaxID=1004150 RepID=A0A4R4ITC9_9GAMM|nr:hypothetical protein PTE_02981 [Photorhabdus khanii NC19]OHV54848.1 hypothetical protein BB987_08975 [Photorhabdus temperata]TDB44087.1 hypothetical protein C5467_23060 [Photorhabdus khanii subsp. guanajuatensis]